MSWLLSLPCFIVCTLACIQMSKNHKAHKSLAHELHSVHVSTPTTAQTFDFSREHQKGANIFKDTYAEPLQPEKVPLPSRLSSSICRASQNSDTSDDLEARGDDDESQSDASSVVFRRQSELEASPATLVDNQTNTVYASGKCPRSVIGDVKS